MRFVPFKIFCLGGYIGSLAPCLVAAQAVCWRLRLAGMQHYDDTPLIEPKYPLFCREFVL